MSVYSVNVTPTETATGQSIAQLSEVSLSFPSNNQPIEILKDVNLELKQGDFVCALGSSGCGKTTLLRILAGYQRPTTGSIIVDGKIHNHPTPEVGVVFQRPNLFPWLTIAKNVEFGLKMRNAPKLERRQRVGHFLDLVGLTHAANLLPHQLSGGMLQRAAIARTLTADPALILMDEPFGALDALTRESMQHELKEIWERTHKTIFFITHDVEEAMLLATRIVVMHARPGRIIKDITNPFARRLGNESVSELRSSKEFVQLREQLIASIRETHVENWENTHLKGTDRIAANLV